MIPAVNPRLHLAQRTNCFKGKSGRTTCLGRVLLEIVPQQIFDEVQKVLAGVGSTVGMRGPIAPDAQLMKEVRNLAGENALKLQPAQQVRLLFVRGSEESGPGGGKLCEDFTELAELDEAGIGIVLEITLRQST